MPLIKSSDALIARKHLTPLNYSNIQKVKSAGYRLIYQVESPTSVLLLTIYSKSDQEDISPNEIRSILAEFDGDE